MTKPIVHYVGDASVVGDRAYLVPVDHSNHTPGQTVTNGEIARTSRVLFHNKLTGNIETQNTRYVPISQKSSIPAVPYFTDESKSQ